MVSYMTYNSRRMVLPTEVIIMTIPMMMVTWLMACSVLVARWLHQCSVAVLCHGNSRRGGGEVEEEGGMTC
jgi:hypothetical protein